LQDPATCQVLPRLLARMESWEACFVVLIFAFIIIIFTVKSLLGSLKFFQASPRLKYRVEETVKRF
jgi:hypothetical protein